MRLRRHEGRLKATLPAAPCACRRVDQPIGISRSTVEIAVSHAPSIGSMAEDATSLLPLSDDGIVVGLISREEDWVRDSQLF